MNWLQLILKYLAVALQIIPIIQTVIPTAPGPVKNAVAVAMLNPPEAEKAAVAGLVSTVVGSMVAGGAWAKDGTPPAGIVPPAV